MDVINQIAANWEHICAYAMLVITATTAFAHGLKTVVHGLDKIARETGWDWDDPIARQACAYVDKLADFLDKVSATIPRITVGRK